MIARRATDKLLEDACSFHPCPWHTIEARTGILIKDKMGATVLFMQAGTSTRSRKHHLAKLLVKLVNDAYGQQA